MATLDVKVMGAESLSRLARDLKAAGERDLRRELLKGVQRAAKPAKEAAKKAALEELPDVGGLAAEIAGSKFSAKTNTGRNPSVRITAKGRPNRSGREHDLRSLDRGRLRHPLYGNRGHWYNQAVKPDWFTEAMKKQAPEVRKEIVAAIDAVARKLEH